MISMPHFKAEHSVSLGVMYLKQYLFGLCKSVTFLDASQFLFSFSKNI